MILPVTTLFAAAAAVRDTLARLRAGAEGEVPLQFEEFTDLIGLPDAQRLERRYAV